jgi:hypothetical protein
MATVLVKNLPNVSSTDDDDLLIVNIGGGSTVAGSEYTTSNIKIGDLRTVLNSSGNNFSGDIIVDGSVTITALATQSGKTFVGNLVGQVTGQATTVETLTNHSTDTLTEGTSNKYFTQTNFNAAVQVTQVGMLADVTVSGGGTASNGEILLHNGTAFVNTPVSAYDQSAEVADLEATKAPLESPDFTGQATMGGSGLITNALLSNELADYALLVAPELTGSATLDGSAVINLLTLNSTLSDYALLVAPELTGSATLNGSALVTVVDLNAGLGTCATLADLNAATADIAALQGDTTDADAAAAAQDTADKIQTKLSGLSAATYASNDIAELQNIITTLIGELKVALS